MSAPFKPGKGHLESSKTPMQQAFPGSGNSSGRPSSPWQAWASDKTSSMPASAGGLRSTSTVPLPSYVRPQQPTARPAQQSVAQFRTRPQGEGRSQTTAGISPSSRIAVVLTPPQNGAEYGFVQDDDEEDELVISDLSPQFKRKTTGAQASQQSMLSQASQQSTLSQARKPESKSPVPTSYASATKMRNVSTPMPTSQQTPATQTSSKSRGRPKGWKPGMSYADVRDYGAEHAPQNTIVNPRPPKAANHNPGRVGRPPKPKDPTAITTKGGVPKRRGRPPRALTPPAREVYEKLNPRFLNFGCEWAGCLAGLHNLETLRRHMWIVHCEGQEAPLRCRWGKCADPSLAKSDEQMVDMAALKNHIQEEHLVPFSWHLGDGPKAAEPGVSTEASGTGEKVPDFLLDENGKQVTPSVQDQVVESFVDWQARRRRLKEALQRMNDALPDPGSSSESAEA